MSAHTSNPESDRETRNREQTYSVHEGVDTSGRLVFSGTLEDALYLNRRREGQSRVWRDSDGAAITLPKMPGRMAVRLAEFHLGAEDDGDGRRVA